MTRVWWLLAGLLLVASCGYGGVPAAEAPPVNGDQLPAVVAPVSSEVAEPVSMTIPALKVTDDIVPVGLCATKDPPRCETGTGEMELPNVSELGYYKLAPKPGEAGRAVILGHVDYEKKPGAFKHLGSLKPGDRFTVTDADGNDLIFEVYKVATGLKKSRYATDTVPLLFSPTDNHEVGLITCSGAVSDGEYSDNTVVLARLVAV